MNQISTASELSKQSTSTIDSSLDIATTSHASQAALVKLLVDSGLNKLGVKNLSREQLGELEPVEKLLHGIND